MKFDWTELTAIDFTNYCAKVENNMFEADEYVGCVRVGELCFDILLQNVGYGEGEKLVMVYDLYVGGVDTGYGYSDTVRAQKMYNGESYDDTEKNPTFPYDYAEGGSFEDSMISWNYDDFKKHAEAEFEKFIKTWKYPHASLLDKANEPLHIW